MPTTNENVTPSEFKGFSEKAHDFIVNSNYFINIAEGAVRSGKTILVIYRFMISLIEQKGLNYAIAGRTVKTSHRNVVMPLLQILKAKDIPFEYSRGNHEITVFFKEFTKKIYIFGADNVDSENKLAGLTLQAILIDEASRCDKGFF